MPTKVWEIPTREPGLRRFGFAIDWDSILDDETLRWLDSDDGAPSKPEASVNPSEPPPHGD